MNRTTDVLDRLAPLFEPPGHGLEDLLQRRKKKEQARKVGAIGLVTAILATFVAVGLGNLGTRRSRPADPAPIQPRNGKIAYADNGQITVVEPDGSGKVQLTGGSYPAWSADGTKIAYVRGASLFVMNADGSGQTLVQGAISDRTRAYLHPSWSPDGSQLVFAILWFSDGRDRSELYVVDVDGSGLTEITPGPLQGWWPSWSPDGTRIAFRDGLSRRLATMSPDGSNLTLFPGSADYADWSPDGSQIIFMSGFDVFRINSDGTGRTNLTHSPEEELFPVYSPDGTQIAFRQPNCGSQPPPCRSSRGAYIVTMLIGGTDFVRVAEVDHVEDSLSWQPTYNRSS